MNFNSSEFRKSFFADYEKLIKIPSPSGYSERKSQYLLEKIQKYCQNVYRSSTGNTYCFCPGKSKKSILFLSHFDVLGLTIDHIKKNGRIAFKPEGDFMFQSIENSPCTVHSASGDYSGIIRTTQSSLHLFKETAREQKRGEENMEIILHLLNKKNMPILSKKDLEQYGICSGDPISLDPLYQHFDNGFIVSRGHDNQSGTQILLTLIELISKVNFVPDYNLLFSFNHCEERGYPTFIPTEFFKNLLGPDNFYVIAVDAILNDENQDLNEKMTYICTKDKIHRYHSKLSKHLKIIAQKNKILHQSGYMKNYGTELSMKFLYGYDAITGMIGPVVDAMHSIERTHEDSIVNSIKVIWHMITDMPFEI